MRKIYIIIAILVLFPGLLTAQVRLKDLMDMQGAASTQIIGYGLVVGLDGTGDGTRSFFTIQSIVNMLQRFGLSVEAAKIKPKNIAAVMVTAELPPFVRPGSSIDVTVSSISDARSLEGGILLMTPLLSVEGEQYVQAQGPVSIGGMNAGAAGASISVNHALVGRIPQGGSVLQGNPAEVLVKGAVTLLLRNPDFTTATRCAEAINELYGQPLAMVLDAGTVEVRVPPEVMGPTETFKFLSNVENIEIQPDMPARVVINERTGTIVVGSHAKLTPIAISHGSLSIKIGTTTSVSQPAPFSQGQTRVDTGATIEVSQPESRLMVIEQTPDIGSMAKALNALGVTPRDIIAIFQALKEAGALQAELIII
ncbi:flagellar basal body P-ring protein FlgI [bacterium]|nr:flagellar basal body P-ring protein FlgI [FCB group bacterium]MBL7190149.1 flagellar basal body P-ring protein FlgI [bacterium]